ncbi:protein jagunal isoform X2 [Daphnia magna]|uniref:Protein jagunal n=3 Tax=Daphnia TaxID=6668 RepID=A0A164KJL0_9CRUS|nr:protein jagunal isoform X2 [Daphnia magna]KAI9560988.1 hypothetical protein GHT06_011944 [Daphnia sinensis]KAK4005080.1 hypothetical protein OUZ56_006804 [Daphnia magna]KZS03321.1 Protein jagunal [Daphnia magna]
MATRGGPVASGTDGSDYGHRERVANQYRISAQSKSRLKACLFFHILLFFLMLAKLSADIFDRLDIFILEIEELEIPKPLVWEYAWCCSLPFVFYGLSSLRRNVIRSMSVFVMGDIVFALLPVFFSLGYYMGDFWQYVSSRSSDGLMLWQGYPYALLWYAFSLVALQIHCFSLYFAHTLISAWRARGGAGTKKIN